MPSSKRLIKLKEKNEPVNNKRKVDTGKNRHKIKFYLPGFMPEQVHSTDSAKRSEEGQSQ